MRALLVALAFVSQVAFAQASWPQREVKVLIGFSPGGTTDIITRLISAELSRLWSQPMVIENRPKAGGNLAGDLRDLAPISLVAHVPNMLVFAPRAMPAGSFQELIALLRANPGRYFYASTGNGTSSHLSAELLRQQAGVSITHVPYKGAVAVNDVLAGESVHFMFATIPSVINHVRSGRLRALAVTSAKRSAGRPELPTVAESGFPGFDASSWFGLVGPVGSTPQELTQYMRAETAKWASLVKASGATVD